MLSRGLKPKLTGFDDIRVELGSFRWLVVGGTLDT